MEHDLIVIGAGAGGLSAAISAAATGRRTRVLEAGREAGGKIGRATHDEVAFDTGPSVLTMVDVLDDLFRLAGTSLEEELELVRPTPAFRYRYPDGVTLDVYHDPQRTTESVRRTLGEDAASEFTDFLEYARGIWEAAAPNFIYGQAPSFGSILKMGFRSLGSLRSIDPMRSMWSGICSRVSSRHLRWLFARYATYNGSDPRKAPATLNCISHVELSRGCYGVRGGMYQLVRRLEHLARDLGVEFRFDEPVLRIVVRSGRVAGVETSSGFLAANTVVSNADVAHLRETLLETAPSELENEQEPSMSGWTAVVRAKRREERCAHEVLFPSDYISEFDDIFGRNRPPQEPTVYVCAQEKAHLRPGWQDHEPLFVMVNAPPEPAGSRRGPDIWENLRDRVMTRLLEASLIDPDDKIVWERTPGGLADRFAGSRGSIYGAASNSQFAAFRRPPNTIESVPGLHIASGGAHPGGGVPLCLLSGMAAGRHL